MIKIINDKIEQKRMKDLLPGEFAIIKDDCNHDNHIIYCTRISGKRVVISLSRANCVWSEIDNITVLIEILNNGTKLIITEEELK